MAKKLSQMSFMPQMQAAFAGWFSTVKLVKVEQLVDDDGLIQTLKTEYCFKGTVQPLDPEKIKLMADGQQSWEWLQIHCLAGCLNLKTADKIIYKNKVYKVMNKLDYSLNNYVEYQLVFDYQP